MIEPSGDGISALAKKRGDLAGPEPIPRNGEHTELDPSGDVPLGPMSRSQFVEVVARDRFVAIDELGELKFRTLLSESLSVECLSLWVLIASCDLIDVLCWSPPREV